jgi:hypothetical protein
MLVKFEINNEEIVDQILKQELLDIRETYLESISLLAFNYQSLPKYEIENFVDAIELFNAANVLLRYVTTADEFDELTA